VAPDPLLWAFPTGGERTEQFQWLTMVDGAATGPEQLQRVRQTPRIVLGAAGKAKGQARQLLETQLQLQGIGPWIVPVESDALQLTSPISIGATAIAGDASRLRFKVGGKALLLGDNPRIRELVTVDSFNSGGVTLAVGTELAWPAGARIVPAYRATLDNVPQLQRFTGDESFYSVGMRLAESLTVAPADDVPTYRGFPVYELGSDWARDPELTHARDIVSKDASAAMPFLADLVGHPATLLARTATAYGSAAAFDLIRFMYLLAGRAQPLWVPSLGHDLTAPNGITSGASTINVGWAGLVDAGLRTSRRDIRVELTDGTILYRRVTAVTFVDSARERLFVDAPWPASVAAEGIAQVSFMTFARQNADVNRLNWWNGDTLETEFLFVGIVDDAV
jgi:hypothetical protein